ncbi:MAG: DNA gyrase C-terminal beta-propeller domain-containing protein, partial [Candidatus Stygibacter australis]|nr:DNA gyrase C-terminal beta-propeller domain-containing protein [Candidatus Stygibacter australis]
GGKGLSGSNLKEEDFVESIFVASTHAYILFFTNLGKCYWLKVHKVPKVGRTARGKAIVNLLQIEKNEKIESFVTVRDFNQPWNITMVTKHGTVKKTVLEAYSRPRVTGIIAINLDEGDQLIDSQLTTGDNNIILATRFGYANRFDESDVRSVGRNSRGVRGISLRQGDEVVAMVIIKREGTLLAISENGYGKRSPVEDYGKTKRGSKGVITLRTSARNGKLISLLEVVDNDDLMIVTREGMIIRLSVDKISVIGRATQGVRLINLHEGDKVYDIARITPDDSEDDGEEGDENGNEIETEDTEQDENEVIVDSSDEGIDDESEAEEIEETDDIDEDESENNLDEKDRPAVQEEIEF